MKLYYRKSRDSCLQLTGADEIAGDRPKISSLKPLTQIYFITTDNC